MADLEEVTNTLFMKVLKEAEVHIKNLKLIVESTGQLPEGGIIYHHLSFVLIPEKIPMQKNLVYLGSKSTYAAEVGFGMGHSALLLLLSNPDLYLDCFDVCANSYTEHCFNYLNIVFKDRIRLIKGDSRETCKLYKPKNILDLIHIDGSLDPNVIREDIFNLKNKTRKDGYIILNNTWKKDIYELWVELNRRIIIGPLSLFPTNQHHIGSISAPRIALCTLAIGEEYKDIVKYAQKTKSLYAERHMYDFKNDEDCYDSSRPPAWSKIQLLLRYIKDYDYLIWVDADAHIMNPLVRFEEIIEMENKKKDMLFAQDHTQLNSGVFFMKCNDWVKSFLEKVYESVEFLHHPNWEQKAIINLINENILDSQEHVEIIPIYKQTLFNSYYNQYKDGHFIVHLAGCFRGDEITWQLREMMNRYCPLRMENDTDESFNKRMDFLGRKTDWWKDEFDNVKVNFETK